MNYTLKELAIMVHNNAKLHGWWDNPREFPELLALIHSEVSEALEEYRNHNPITKTYYSGKAKLKEFLTEWKELPENSVSNEIKLISKTPTGYTSKPEGIPSELADVVIRVFDICEYYGIDLEKAILEKHDYNVTRPFLHGGKKL